MDPSVWAAKGTESHRPDIFQGRSNFPPAPAHHHQQQSTTNASSMNLLVQLMKSADAAPPIKMCTVEELERNMLNQQQQKQQPKEEAVGQFSPEKIMKQHQHQGGMPRFGFPPPPPGLFSNQMPPPPPHMMPPNRGFPPMPAVPAGFNPMMMPRPRNMPFPMPGGQPHPMGNYGGPMFRGPMQPPPPPPGSHPMMQRPQQFPPNPAQSVNQFNQRLVEEIQQNHPMLSFNRFPPNMANMQNGANGVGGGGFQPYNRPPQHRNNLQQQQGGVGGMLLPGPHQQPNGNLKPEPQDPYANLMSNRDKQWLISIQLMQLHTETPYYDDFYFTVYKERKAKGESRAHISNTLNHPFNQGPKGHAHNMFLVSLSNKNGLNHHHNSNNTNKNNGGSGGLQNRERKSSESKTGDTNKEQGRTHYTPLQFENSLGKLQVGVSLSV